MYAALSSESKHAQGIGLRFLFLQNVSLKKQPAIWQVS
jgi:hypothetical protein